MKLRDCFKPLVLMSCFHAFAVFAQDPAAPSLRVELSGLAQASGNVFVTVYDSESTWLGEERVMQRKVAIAEALEGDVVLVELTLPQGDYALSIFYDANGNDKLDSNFMGLPKEPIALSNNTKPKFGPPKYEEAVFSIDDELVVQQISMGEM